MVSNVSEDPRVFMRLALDQAVQSAAAGEVPIGAVLVQQGIVLAQSHNHRETWRDPTAHAEMIVIREAARALGQWRLIDTTLFVTLEPCAMCLGAILLARIPRLVFGTRDPKRASKCCRNSSRSSEHNNSMAEPGKSTSETQGIEHPYGPVIAERRHRSLPILPTSQPLNRPARLHRRIA